MARTPRGTTNCCLRASGEHANEILAIARVLRTPGQEAIMEVLYPCCCGLDAHKKSITACVLWAEPKGKVRKEKRRFLTFTRELSALADWLRACGVTYVAMESTGVLNPCPSIPRLRARIWRSLFLVFSFNNGVGRATSEGLVERLS
jgi:hypothetical protein